MTGSDVALNRKLKNLTQNELALALGISRVTVYNWEVKGSKIPESKKGILENFFSDLSIVEKKQENKHNKYGIIIDILKDNNLLIKVPMITKNNLISYIKNIANDDVTELIEFEKVSFKVEKVSNAKYLAFEVNGDSMNSGLLYDVPDKSVVLGVKTDIVEIGKLTEKPKYGFVIITESNMFFKDIFEINAICIKCRSRNNSPEYSDFDLPNSEIIEIYEIIKMIM